MDRKVESPNAIEKDGYRITWSANVSRWQKNGKDRLYIGRNYIDLNDLDAEFMADANNPYGLRNDRIIAAGQRVGNHFYHGSMWINIDKA